MPASTYLTETARVYENKQKVPDRRDPRRGRETKLRETDPVPCDPHHGTVSGGSAQTQGLSPPRGSGRCLDSGAGRTEKGRALVEEQRTDTKRRGEGSFLQEASLGRPAGRRREVGLGPEGLYAPL